MLYFYTDYMEGAHPEVMRHIHREPNSLSVRLADNLKPQFISSWEVHKPMQQ